MITRLQGRGEVELYSFQLTDMVRWGYQGLRNLTPAIGERQIRGIPAIHRAARFRAQELGKLQLFCWTGRGPTRTRVENAWQSRLFLNRPNTSQTRFGLWETVEESLCYRGNAYVWKNSNGGRVIDWWALHPDQVSVLDDGSYKVRVTAGYVDPVGKGPGVYKDLGPDTILHIRGHGDGGQLIAPSPVEVFRNALMVPVERKRHESRMYRRGVAAQLGVEFPQGISKDQAEQWKEGWRSSYEGTEGETTLVIGGGATIKPIGLSPADAQFAESYQLDLMDAAFIMGVSANLLGVTGAVGRESRVDLVQERQNWLQNEWASELQRIEDHLLADEQLFGQQARLRTNASASLGIYPGFDTEGFVRGDLMTEATILQGFVQSGVLTPDEARHELGYAPHPNGMGAEPQLTPVGGSPNPLKPAASVDSNSSPDDE